MLYALAISFLAFAMRLLTFDGAVAATIVGGLIWEAGKWSTAIPLLMFFFSAGLISRIGKARKKTLGLEAKPRNAIQVFANGGPSSICAALFLWTNEPVFFPALIGGIASATADTWATEIGAAFGKKVFRITTLETAVPGKSGAVSTHGIIASFFGAAFIASTASLVGRTDLIPILTTLGFFGSILDSILGDLFQDSKKTRWMTNDMVNFISVSVITICSYFAAR
ncbi:MAG TPA: DUF92 domain-containing protein [Fimbriimonadales bacterium]|nr:DUF92 domain-containing protein [Fimbriimonadales bacterium]